MIQTLLIKFRQILQIFYATNSPNSTALSKNFGTSCACIVLSPNVAIHTARRRISLNFSCMQHGTLLFLRYGHRLRLIYILTSSGLICEKYWLLIFGYFGIFVRDFCVYVHIEKMVCTACVVAKFKNW